MKQVKFRLSDQEYALLQGASPGYGGISKVLVALVRAYLEGRVRL